MLRNQLLLSLIAILFCGLNARADAGSPLYITDGGIRFTFHKDPEHKINTVTVDGGKYSNLVLKRVPKSIGAVYIDDNAITEVTFDNNVADGSAKGGSVAIFEGPTPTVMLVKKLSPQSIMYSVLLSKENPEVKFRLVPYGLETTIDLVHSRFLPFLKRQYGYNIYGHEGSDDQIKVQTTLADGLTNEGLIKTLSSTHHISVCASLLH